MSIATVGGADLTWNLAGDLRQLFAYHFMVNAFRAGTIVAIASALIGWCLVLRRQSFVGHTLSVVAFPGASAALWLGVSVSWGYFGACLSAAIGLGLLPRTGTGDAFGQESAITGTLQAVALGAGLLFVALYGGFLNGLDALLFGSFLGVTDDQVAVLAIGAGVGLAALAAIARPLFFASVDPDVAAARGVPVRLVSSLFLVLLGIAVAEVSQITGALLVFGLLVMPAAAARRLTSRPIAGVAVSVLIAVGVTWTGLAVSYFSAYPVGFSLTTVAFAVHGAAVCLAPRRNAFARIRRATPGTP